MRLELMLPFSWFLCFVFCVYYLLDCDSSKYQIGIFVQHYLLLKLGSVCTLPLCNLMSSCKSYIWVTGVLAVILQLGFEATFVPSVVIQAGWGILWPWNSKYSALTDGWFYILNIIMNFCHIISYLVSHYYLCNISMLLCLCP